MLSYNSFRRVTTGKQLLEEIDGLRFLAIFYVIVAHLHGFFWVKTPFFQGQHKDVALIDTMGDMGRDDKHGVAIFFIISGFILALPFARYYFGLTKNKIGLKDYFLRRLTRLEPPYIIALVLLMGVIILKNINTFEGIFPHFAASLFYVHNIVYNDMSAVLPVAWSLEVEVQFYILAPVLSMIFLLKNKWVRYALLLTGMVASAFIQETPLVHDTFALKYSLLGWLQYFLAGLLLADIYLNNKQQSGMPKWFQILIGAGLLYAISFLPYDGGAGQRILYPVVCLLFFVLVVLFPVWKKVFSLPFISITGGMCYSIYLLHFATISFIGNYSIHYKVTDSLLVNYLVQWLIIGAAILAVAGAYFLLIEKPCMRKDWPQRLRHFVLGARKPDVATSVENAEVKILNERTEPLNVK